MNRKILIFYTILFGSGDREQEIGREESRKVLAKLKMDKTMGCTIFQMKCGSLGNKRGGGMSEEDL